MWANPNMSSVQFCILAIRQQKADALRMFTSEYKTWFKIITRQKIWTRVSTDEFDGVLSVECNEQNKPNFCSCSVTLGTEHLRNRPLKPTGHYMYLTVVTICTAQWSLYVPHSGHYMYLTVVTICTAQRSLYVPHSGHYMYRTVVTICTAQR